MAWKQALRIAAISFGLAAGVARAELVLEYDFRNPTFGGGAGTTASYTANGGSPDADLLGGVNGSNRPNLQSTYTLSTGLNGGYDTRLQTGYISLRASAGPDQAVGTSNRTTQAPHDHWLSQYMGSNTFDSGSMVFFFKPQTLGVSANRQTFFFTGNDNNSNNMMWLLNDDDYGGPTLRRNSGVMATLGSLNPEERQFTGYEADTWYMLAVSWEANDTLGGAENVIYLRALKDGSTPISSISSTFLLDGTTPIDTSSNDINIGRRKDNGEETINSDIALFQMYNNSATVEQMDAYYLSMTPEPASLSVIVMTAGFLLRRRRA